VPFLFAGFPPRTAAKRRTFYQQLAPTLATLVLFEAPHRLLASLRDACAALGDRPACLARNLTKPHERWQRGSLARLIGELEGEEASEGAVRGEATVVIGGAPEGATGESAEEASGVAAALLESGVEARDVVERLVRDHGLRRRAAYSLVVRLRGER
jgi:16S rRNA (cytidine1402-2'-O)-methyltransferase